MDASGSLPASYGEKTVHISASHRIVQNRGKEKEREREKEKERNDYMEIASPEKQEIIDREWTSQKCWNSSKKLESSGTFRCNYQVNLN